MVVLEWTPSTVRSTWKVTGFIALLRRAAAIPRWSAWTGKFSRYVDNTVTNEVTYYYVVTAFDRAGNESPFSDEVSITPSALKGMPSSGATLPETIAESPWVWMGALTVTLLVLVGIRRGSFSPNTSESDDPNDASEADEGSDESSSDESPA